MFELTGALFVVVGAGAGRCLQRGLGLRHGLLVDVRTIQRMNSGPNPILATPCHSKCAPSEIEMLAHKVTAEVLQDSELLRVCEVEPAGLKKPDFRSRRHAVEVKELISPSMASYGEAHDRHFGDKRHFPVKSFRNLWGVMPDLTDAIESFDRTESPYLPRLIRRLIPLIEQLEAKGLTYARADPWIARSVASLIHGDSCSVMPEGPYTPGIFILGYGWGLSRTTDPERDVVECIQAWLRTSQAEKARLSFDHEREVRRVLALVASMEGPASAMIRTLSEDPEASLRTPLQLPEGIDAVVVIAADQVLDYGLVDGWRRRPA